MGKDGTDQVVGTMAGTAPTKLQNLGKGTWWHNWLRNIRNEFFGPSGSYSDFLSKVTKKYGNVDWFTHSGGFYEVLSIDPRSNIFVINPHIPKGAELGEGVFIVRTDGDILTNSLDAYDELRGRQPRGQNNHVAHIGPGGHGISDALTNLKDTDWDAIFPNPTNIVGKITPDGPKVFLPKSEYPNPKFGSKNDLWDATYKRIKEGLYADYRAKELEKILKKTNDPKKIGKKIDKVFDDIERHPVDKQVRQDLKGKAWNSVTDDLEYQFEAQQFEKKVAIDGKIKSGELEVVDKLPEVLEVPSRSLSDGIANTFISYALSGGVMTFSISALVRINTIRSRWTKLTREERWRETRQLIKEAAKDGAWTGFELGSYAAIGQIVSNALEMGGYACSSAIPFTVQVCYGIKDIVGYLAVPRVKPIIIDLSPYLPYFNPKPAASIHKISRISGRILQIHAHRVAIGVMDPANAEEDIKQIAKEVL